MRFRIVRRLILLSGIFATLIIAQPDDASAYVDWDTSCCISAGGTPYATGCYFRQTSLLNYCIAHACANPAFMPDICLFN